jgi:hypothetical protein
MRSPAMPPAARPIAAIAAALLSLALAVSPVAAKEFVEARLDAPIPMGLAGGTEILVGITVSVTEADGTHPVVGTPMYLRLIGRDGATTRAAGAGDHTDGHYTFRIAIPAGGARDLEIGIHGSSDLPVMLAGDPFAAGGVTARTAQLAPPLPAAPTPKAVAPVAVAPAADPAATAVGPVAPVAPAAPVAPWAIVGLAAAAAALVVVLAARALRARRPPVARDAA